MKKLVNLNYYISMFDDVMRLEIYNNHEMVSGSYDFKINGGKNTPYGYLSRKNAFSKFIFDVERQFEIEIVNNDLILNKTLKYLSCFGPRDLVVNYLVYPLNLACSKPIFTNSYTTDFKPTNLVANISQMQMGIDSINLSKLHLYLKFINYKNKQTVINVPWKTLKLVKHMAKDSN